MTSLTHFAMPAALAGAFALAGPALADVTAQGVWAGWQAATAEMGIEMVAASEDFAGDTLTVDEVSFALTMPDGTVTGEVERILMTEQGDGTVQITLPGAYTLTVDTVGENGEPVTIDLAVEYPGLEMIASGGDGTTVFDYTADAIGIALASLTIAGQDVPGTLDIGLDGVSGSYTLVEDDGFSYESALYAAVVTADIAFTDPADAANTVAVTAEYSDFVSEGAGNSLALGMTGSPEAFLADDVQQVSRYSHGGGGYDITGTSTDSGAFAFAAHSEAGDFDMTVDEGGIGLSGGTNGVTITASGDQIPMPELTLGLDQFDMAFAMPLQPAEEASDFGLRLNLAELTVPEELWSMVDPTGALPHDPATLLVELDGQVRLTAALDDEEAMAAPTPPLDFSAFDLTQLRLSLAGAELTGTGSFDFSEAPEGALPGMPGVSGVVDLTLMGGNALLDTLVSMGLVPEDQAMFARMMVGMLARPAGDDTLESRIEFGADGSITANGNPLR